MDILKPSIYIYISNTSHDLLKEIEAGIEEEGCLYEVFEKDSDNISKLAYEAANSSVLETGIALINNVAYLQLAKFPVGKYIFKATDSDEFRKLGVNAARAVKGKPFKM